MKTAEQVRALVDSASYTDALQALAGILRLNGKAAAAYNRSEMLLLKAECQLQLGDKSASITTLGAAQRESNSVGDTNNEAQAAGLRMLLQKSNDKAYIPLTGEQHDEIPIADRTLRARAYEALFIDELADQEKKNTLAQKQASLAPILDVAKDFSQLQLLERAATGKAEKTEQMAADLARSAGKLVDSTMDDFKARIDRIEKNGRDAANSRIVNSRGRKSHGNHGLLLSSQDIQMLNGIRADCEKLPAAIEQLNTAFGQHLSPKGKLHAQDFVDRINDILEEAKHGVS